MLYFSHIGYFLAKYIKSKPIWKKLKAGNQEKEWVMERWKGHEINEWVYAKLPSYYYENMQSKKKKKKKSKKKDYSSSYHLQTPKTILSAILANPQDAQTKRGSTKNRKEQEKRFVLTKMSQSMYTNNCYIVSYHNHYHHQFIHVLKKKSSLSTISLNIN